MSGPMGFLFDLEKQQRERLIRLSLLQSVNNEIIQRGVRIRRRTAINAALLAYDTITTGLDSLGELIDIVRENAPTPERVVQIQFGNIHYTLSGEVRTRLLASLTDGTEFFDLEDGFESDTEVIIAIQNIFINGGIPEITLSSFKPTNKTEGGFFPWFHKRDKIFLQRYGIFSDENSIPKNYYDDNCLIHCLQESKLFTSSKINEIKLMTNVGYIPLTKLGEIANKLEVQIHVYKLRKTDTVVSPQQNRRGEKYGLKAHNTILKICLLGKHFFIYDEITEYTLYSIKNYDKIKHKKNWNYFYKEKARNAERCLDSFNLVKLLISERNLLEKIDRSVLDTCIYSNDLKYSEDFLEFGDANYSEMKYLEKKEQTKKVCFMDFETTTDGDIHIPYMLCNNDNGQVKCYKGKDFIYNFLDEAEDGTTFIAHNLGYDIKFIICCLTVVTHIIEKSLSSIISLTGIYKKKTLYFKCSYAMISCKLSEFGEMFNLTQNKDILPYEIYTNDNVKKSNIKIKDCLVYLKPDEHSQFIKNIDEWGCRIDDVNFDHIKYSEVYCRKDVIVLREGYNKFSDMIKQVTGLNCIEYITAASLSYDYTLKEGCFDGCYQVCGNLRAYLQKFIVGGRTMVRCNEKIKIEKNISDFDGVSLYPSAMAEMHGYIKGKASIINRKDNKWFYENIFGKDFHYFVTIDVTKVNKKRNFPLLNRKNKNGIREFSNDLLGVHYVDKYGLEDLIKFQEIEFNVLYGVYFEQGYNSTINVVIRNLFNERIIKKKEKNNLQIIYKLLMNVCYGKTALKPITKEVKIMNKTEFDTTYVKKNYNKIISHTDIYNSNSMFNKNKVKVKLNKPIVDHYNCAHIGASILAYSKRIMNQVICLAEDHNMIPYYQDTDSIHIDKDVIPDLNNLYGVEYGKVLIGKDMGQFHCDFDYKSDEEPYAVSSIFLGKKSYIDKVRVINNGVESHCYHYRMKGIPHEVLNITSEQFDGIYNMYEYLYEGNEIKFNLLDGRCKFKSNNDYTIKSLRKISGDSFDRTLKF